MNIRVSGRPACLDGLDIPLELCFLNKDPRPIFSVISFSRRHAIRRSRFSLLIPRWSRRVRPIITPYLGRRSLHSISETSPNCSKTSMESPLRSPTRRRDSILTGGRPIRNIRSRSSSRGRGLHHSEPLLEFVDDILRFWKVLLRQDSNPLRDDLASSQSGDLDVIEESKFGKMEDVETTDLGTDPLAEDWSTRCANIKMEMNRLVMWKFDVLQKRLSPALNAESRLYSVLCESLLSIGEIVKSRKLSYLLARSTKSNG